MGTIGDMKSSLTQSALDALCEKFHISRIVHPELPGRNQRIHNSPTGKIGVYTRFFDFANYRIQLSHFFVDILEYFQINLSQLSVIAAAKVSHFEILCRVHGFVPTVGNFLCDFLATHPAPFQKFPESFLCLVGISRYYELDDNVYLIFLADDDEGMDLFAFINHADPTKVRIGEKKIKEGQVPLLESTRGRVVPLAGVNEQGNQNDNVQDVGAHVVQDDGVNIVVDEEIETAAAEKPKKLREDHGTFADVGANTGEKSLVAIHELFDQSTLNVETQHPTERFVISSDSSHHSSTNVADDEVTSIIKSPVPPPPIMTASIATTAIAGATSALVHESGIEPVQRNIFRDSASPSTVEADVVGLSQPAVAEVSTDTFYISQEMDSETL
ncbi:hypothetical protein Tco_1286834 [Tanacetum coccineum]